MSGDLNRVLANAFDDLGHNDHNMERGRPYTGQPHTDTGERGQTEIRGITFRDLRDAFIRAVCLSGHHVVPHLYAEADKGEKAALCEADLYGWSLDLLDPMAISQNLSCEVEKLMGIFSNVPPLTYGKGEAEPRGSSTSTAARAARPKATAKPAPP